MQTVVSWLSSVAIAQKAAAYQSNYQNNDASLIFVEYMVDEERLFAVTFLSSIHFPEILELVSPWDRCVMQDTTHFRIEHLDCRIAWRHHCS